MSSKKKAKITVLVQGIGCGSSDVKYLLERLFTYDLHRFNGELVQEVTGLEVVVDGHEEAVCTFQNYVRENSSTEDFARSVKNRTISSLKENGVQAKVLVAVM